MVAGWEVGVTRWESKGVEGTSEVEGGQWGEQGVAGCMGREKGGGRVGEQGVEG